MFGSEKFAERERVIPGGPIRDTSGFVLRQPFHSAACDSRTGALCFCAMKPSNEIRCTACGRETLARCEPVFTGFKKTGEEFVCTGCGHRFPSREETPFIATDNRPKVFTDADKPETVQIFHSNERRRSCGWCRHYIINPFNQRCGLSNRETEATDVCARFASKEEEKSDAATGASAPKKTADRFDALFKKSDS